MSIHILDWNQDPPSELVGGALSIGNFDGVHLGHQALLAETRERARAIGGPAVVLSFDPHPLKLLRPEAFQPVLTTAADRAELLLAAGADQVALLRTDVELLRLSAPQFFDEVIKKRLRAKVLVEGPNFGFGRNREGNIESLRMLASRSGIEMVVVAPVKFEDRPVSSSRVRDALLRGRVDEASQLLNRPYRLRGRVVTGRQRGKSLGFPTANLGEIPTLVPGDGVYAVRVHLSSGALHSGAANVGPNPTFGEQARKVEVHLIGFAGDLVGQELALDFVQRLRDTKQFASAAKLIEQLQTDVALAEKVIGESSTAE
jgi:riboflavin kinase/FMN adenylyltransferase